MFMLALSAIVLSNSAPVAQEPAASKPEEQIICKHQARTGTRFTKKTCRTKAHWEEMAETAKRQAAEDLNKPTINIDKGN